MYFGRRGFGGIVQDLSAAITRQEGTPASWNNPGALRSGPGQVGTTSNGIAIFPDYATGEAALERQVQLNIDRGLTLQQFFAGQRDANGNVIAGGYYGYAPAADSNQPNVYTQNVSSWTGLPVDVPLSTLAAGGGEITPAAGSGLDSSGSTLDLSFLDLSSLVSSLDPVTVGVGVGIVLLSVFLAFRS